MATVALTFLLSLACSAVFTPLVIKLAHRLNAIDHALSSRKIHGRPIPRLGGIAIAAAFFVPITGLLLVNSGVGRLFYSDGLRPLGLYVGGALIALLGIYDDLKGAGAKLKFSVQFAVAALVYFLGYRIDALANPFGPTIQLGWLGLPFTMFWIAGVINAINLIDGLDGLAGGVALVAVGMTFVLALLRAEPLMMLFTAALAGALIGFLRYNFNPAKIFMGDTGSMFLGFVLAVSAIETSQKSSTAVAILIPIIVLGLPITDTMLAIWRRGVRGAPLFHADRGHIHHRLLDAGLTQRAACLALWGVSLALGLVALVLAFASSGQLQHAAEVGMVWESVRAAAPALGAECACLRMAGDPPGSASSCDDLARRRCHAAGKGRSCTGHNLRGERPGARVLALGWNDQRTHVDSDTERAVEQLCGHLHAALERIDARAVAAGEVSDEYSLELVHRRAAGARR